MTLITIQDSINNPDWAEVIRNDVPSLYLKTTKSKIRKSEVYQVDITPNELFVKVHYSNDSITLDPTGIDSVGGIPITDVYSLYDAISTYLNI